MHDYEYHAIRNSAALIDVSPLYKYEVRGTDALKLVNRVITRDAAKCAVGQALYGCLCDDDGAVIQDGTVFRLAEDHFRFNLADPSLRWLQAQRGRNGCCDQGSVRSKSPRSRFKVRMHSKFFSKSSMSSWASSNSFVSAPARFLMCPSLFRAPVTPEIWATKFGFTAEHAERIWDVLVEQGKPTSASNRRALLALDVARLEAGFILLEVDYIGAEKALIASQRYSPFEIGLGWTVDLKKDHFVGARALLKIIPKRAQSRQIVGLEINLDDYEYLYQQVGLPPQFPLAAWRGGVPVYKDDRQVGHATTGAWSPTLKKYLALATMEKDFITTGNPARYGSDGRTRA